MNPKRLAARKPVWPYNDLLHLIAIADERFDPMFRVNSDESDVRCLLNCSDLFVWACADAEEITPADLPDLERAIADLGDAAYWADSLFCCRRRAMRPQGPWYGYCDPHGKVRRHFVPVAIEAIFDACGPERTDAPKSPRPADGRRWDYGGSVEPPEFVDMFKPGGKFGP